MVTEIRCNLDALPEAAVVDLGCGLDCLVGEVDNGRALIHNLDFLSVLEVRRTWAEPHERERELPLSLTDHRWMGEIDASGGLIAVSSGVSQIRVNFDLSSYATDPSALPAQVLDGFAQMRESRALYEVIADFAVAGEPR